MAEPGPDGCLFFFNHSSFTPNGVTETQASTGHQLEWESARKITAAEDTVQGAQGRLSDTLVSSCRAPLFGVRRVKLFILGAESFSFSTCPSFDLFWCRVAVSRKYNMFETKCAQFLLQAFEAKPSDQNKERQWEGGCRGTARRGNPGYQGRLWYPHSTQLWGFSASLLGVRGVLLPGGEVVKKEGKAHTFLKQQWSQRSFIQPQKVLSRAGWWEIDIHL